MTGCYQKIALVLALGLVGCGGETQVADTTTLPKQRSLRIATEGAYPPFNDMTADGQLVGFDVDVMQAVCEEMQAQCTFVAQDWDGIIPGLLNQKYDAIIAGMSITDERAKQVDFSQPYFKNTLVWLTKKDGKFDPNAIKNNVLGGQRSTTAANYITDRFDGKEGNRVQLYDSYINAYLDTKAGRNEAVMAEKVSANDWLKTNPDFALVGEEIDNDDNIAIAVRRGDPLREDINQALNQLVATGKLAQIEARHF